MPLLVRERPSLRQTIDVVTPAGQHFRWAEDERRPIATPSSVTFGSTAPGGFESMSCTLPRNPAVQYQDLDRLSTITVYDGAGGIVWQGRLEQAPRVGGSQMAVTPSAVGWQAHLEDDKSAAEIYIDRDLANWSDMPSQRRGLFLGLFYTLGSIGSEPNITTGSAQLKMEIDGAWATGSAAEAWYDAGSLGVGQLVWSRTSDSSSNLQPSATFVFSAFSCDDGITASDSTGDLHIATEDTEIGATMTPLANRRYAVFNWMHQAANPNAEQYYSFVFLVHVFGRHGLAARGDYPDWGYYASDVIVDAVQRWAPALEIGTISATGFIIPQMIFREPTTVAEIISAANRFNLYDWMVWEGPTFHYYPRGSGKAWRARVAPAQLQEHGPDVARLWNGVIVRYNDVDGTSLTVGPPGAPNVSATDEVLLDTDPTNPANERGLRRWDILDMGGVSTLAGATEIGRRFLIESRGLDTSGQAQLVGYCEDDRGIMWPASHVRAGDTIQFIDASDTSPRRVVRTSYDHSSRTNSVDLDAPPDALAALLERMQVVLVPLGL